MALRPTYQISLAGREAAEVRKHFFTPFGDRFTIDVPGPDDLEMEGDLFDHEFIIRRGDQPVATTASLARARRARSSGWGDSTLCPSGPQSDLLARLMPAE